MLANLYTIFKYKLRYPHWRTVLENATQYIEVDWYLGQDLQMGDQVRNTPIAYIEFLPMTFITLSNGVQHGIVTFNVHLITETAYGDERDMINETIGHQALETGIYKCLHNQRTIIDVNDNLQVVWHENIVRKSLTPHTRINKLVKSTQTFRCLAYDYSAYPPMISILLTLDLDAILVKTLEIPEPPTP